MEGTPFGRYRLIELLGRGGMGEVWRAHDTDTDRIVAIKLLPAYLSDDEEFQHRFRREAHAAARLNDPHVVPIHNYGEIEGQLYVDMRLIEGRDLQTVLANGPLDPARAVGIIEQVAKALHAAHTAGLLHRDIKPSNILLDHDDFAYLIDFGIARAVDETRITKSGNTIGTFAYIAPERLDRTMGEEDARADIYSLACVLYECLTGGPPFPGTTQHLMYAHVHTPPPRPSITDPDVPATFDPVIATGMAKHPDNRYATTIELATGARDALTTTPSGAPRTAPSPRADQTRPARRPKPGQPETRLRFAPELHEVDHVDLSTTRQLDQLPAPQPRPEDKPPSEPIPTVWPRPIVMVVIAVTILAIGIIGIAGYLSRSPSHTRQTPSAPSAAPSGPTVPPVAEAALQGLLVSPDQIDTAMGATGMTVTGTITTLPDGSGQVPDKACVPLEGAGQATVYTGSGWNAVSAVSGQKVADQSHAHLLEQIVVLFPSAQDARAFFTASAQRWPACSNRQHNENTTAGQPQIHTVGPVSNTNGTLSATITGILARNGTSGVCERALTVANNVAIDIDACGASPSGAAVNIADQIAAKVPTT